MVFSLAPATLDSVDEYELQYFEGVPKVIEYLKKKDAK